MSKRLNGWRRIWIVTTIAWVVVVGAVFAADTKRKSVDYAQLAAEYGGYKVDEPVDLILAKSRVDERTSLAIKNAFTSSRNVDELRTRLDGIPAPTELKGDLCGLKQKTPSAYGYVDVPLEPEPTNYWMWLLALIAPPTALYASGATVAWIIAGFRRST